MDQHGLLPDEDVWIRARSAYKDVLAKGTNVDVSELVMDRIRRDGAVRAGKSLGRSFSFQFRSAVLILGLLILFSGFTYAAASGKISFLKNSKGEVVTEFVPVTGNRPASVPQEHRDIAAMVREQLQPGEVAKVYIGPNDKEELESLITSVPMKLGVFSAIQPYSTTDLTTFPGFSESSFKHFIVPKLKKGYELISTEVTMDPDIPNYYTKDGPIQYQTSPNGQLYAFSKKSMGHIMTDVSLVYRKDDILVRLSITYNFAFSPTKMPLSGDQDILTINNSEVLFQNYENVINGLRWTEILDNGRFEFKLFSEQASRKQLIDIAGQIVNKSFYTLQN